MLYRIYTQDKDRNQVQDIASKYLDGFTLLTGTGFFDGEREKSLILEIVGNRNLVETINNIAKEIKKVNNQESVLIQELQNKSRFV